MRSANPALSVEVFTAAGRVSRDQCMTIEGTVNKTGITLLIVTFTAAIAVC